MSCGEEFEGIAIIIEEVPDVGGGWLVSARNIHHRDPRYKHFLRETTRGAAPSRTTYQPPKFGSLDEARLWCAERGLRWRTRRFHG